MKNLVKVSLAVGAAIAAFAANGNAQTVAVNALGSSGIFLELGLGASSSTGPIAATCVWSENTKSASATDTSVTGKSLSDTGNAWVAWTKGTGTCATPGSNSEIYAYLQTDSVVGNRCLFNGSACTITYPTGNPAPAGLILGTAGEVPLATSVSAKLQKLSPNAAGTDIRPEDAEFAIARALKSCNVAVASGSQYLGLGYTNGGTINSEFSTSTFNVINFSLPKSFTVTPVGATPIVVVVNGDGTTKGFSNTSITNITSATLAKFLDGTYSYTTQVNSSTDKTGDAVKTLVREPLSGTYNTMEYNVPNTTTNKTSQDVGVNQLAAQVACSGATAINPLNIATASGGARQRAIGTGQELSEVLTLPNSIGYGFWSVANFAAYTGTGTAQYAKYLTVDSLDPLLNSSTPYSTYKGALPITGSTELSKVDLHGLNSTTGYPIWSLLRLVNAGTTAPAAVTSLATAAQDFVTFGTTTSRPDFIIPSKLTVVRSHFLPPAGTGEPTAIANGHVGNIRSSACTAPEAGGDVGGVLYTLTADSTYCTNNKVTTGQTGKRR